MTNIYPKSMNGVCYRVITSTLVWRLRPQTPMLAKKNRKQTRLFEQADPGQSFLALIQVEHAGVFYNTLRESDERPKHAGGYYVYIREGQTSHAQNSTDVAWHN